MIYMDAAASALKPQSVIDAEVEFLSKHYANAGRGVCARATAVDEMVAKARNKTAEFIGAKSSDQVIFTSGATDGFNRIARILEISGNLTPDSLIIVSNLDHHSARMPFEELARKSKCNIGLRGNDEETADVFVITAMSNVLGAPEDVKKIVAAARANNPSVITIVDAAQYAAHMPIDAADWDCDFLCFSGHKIGADTGLGIMYMKEPSKWRPDKFGGGMVQSIDGEKWTLMAAPHKFEAGTLPLTQIAGLSAAIDAQTAGMTGVKKLTELLRAELAKNPKIKFVSPEGAHLITFTIDGVHNLDFGAMMGANDVCIRVGNMCATWIHKLLGIDGSCRISLGPWNTGAEVRQVAEIINKITNS